MSAEPRPPAPPKPPAPAGPLQASGARPPEAPPGPATAAKVGTRSTEKRAKGGGAPTGAGPPPAATAPAAPPAQAGAAAPATAPADKARKKGTTSRPGAKKPGPPPRPAATSMGLVVFCAAGLLGAGGGIYLATREAEPEPAPVPAPVTLAPPPVSLAPRTEAPPPEPAPEPARRPSAGDPTEEVENLLAAGRERAAMDLLVERRPAPTISARLRARVLEQAKETLEKTAPTLRALVEKGQDPEQRLARLRARLPASMEGDVDALAAELRAAANLAALKRERREEPGGDPAAEPEEPAEPVPVGPLAGRPPRPGQPEPRPESTTDEPEPAAEPTRPEPSPEPTPEPSRPEPATDAPTAGGEAPAGDGTDTIISDALKDRLHAFHTVRDGVMDVTYGFSDVGERQDFQGRGWDKFEINKVNGMADGHISGPVDLELGAGSRGLGVLTHAVDLAGDFEIDVTLWTAVSGQLSEVVFLCGKQVGVRWGSQLVQVKKGGGVKPLGPDPDRLCYKAESEVQVKMIRRGDTLEVKLNGSRVAQRAFKPGELDGPFGLFAGNVRIVITSLRIRGKVDASKL